MNWFGAAGSAGETAGDLAATDFGTKAETSPPIEAIWRTSVAVMWRASGDAGRKTVRRSGAIVPFMPAICIS